MRILINGATMIDQKVTTRELPTLLEQHRDEIAELWAERTYEGARFRPGEVWLDVLRVSTAMGVSAVIDALSTGSYAALKDYLNNLSGACLRSGFASAEATESLLLGKDAVVSVLSRYSFAPEVIWSMVSELDGCVRWMVAYFNTVYSTETNRRLRGQHEHIAAMLRLGARDPDSIDIDEVLRQVAEGIMAAVDVEHCDFYLMDEQQMLALPKVGVSRRPMPPEAVQYFLSQPPDLTDDPFYMELLERKEPLVSYNAQDDPRIRAYAVEVMNTKSILVVPLVANDRVIAAAVTGTFHEYRAFTEDQIELAWDVARAATLVIENARLHQQNRQMAAVEERERLAREIHDNLAQALSILKLQASNIDELLSSGQVEQAQFFLNEMKHTAAEAHTDAREAITGLRNSVSSAAEFVPALRAYIERFGKTNGLDARLLLRDEANLVLPITAIVQLTRVIQEALANVRKHASARGVCVTLECDKTCLSITVEDDGEGFDPIRVLKEERGGVGLQIMRERAESLGGELHIDAQPGKGTRVVVCLPLSNGK